MTTTFTAFTAVKAGFVGMRQLYTFTGTTSGGSVSIQLNPVEAYKFIKKIAPDATDYSDFDSVAKAFTGSVTVSTITGGSHITACEVTPATQTETVGT